MKITNFKFSFICLIGVIILYMILISGCSKKEKEVESSLIPKANVHVTSIMQEGINDTIFLSAITIYNKKTPVLAPITGYVTMVNVSTGINVARGNEIFKMVTKENRSLNSAKEMIDTSSYRYLLGKITINSPVYGQVTDLAVQEGSYIQEGSPLCTIVNISDLILNLFVPVEYSGYFSRGTSCTIVLPNEQMISGRITGLLSKAEANSQSETYMLKPNASIMIPEGINVKVFTVVQKREDAQLLPKDAVLANETLDKFWVMKLLNDSTAVKVPVRLGLVSKEYSEIIEPKFSSDDQIIVSGNYGLPDTAYISVQPDIDEK
jgi:biotin carboxyl carrier protein